MIRLNVYCSVVPSPRKTRLKSSHQPWLIGCRRAHSPLARVSIRAVKGESNGGNSSYPGQSWDPGLEVEVPYEQRPILARDRLIGSSVFSHVLMHLSVLKFIDRCSFRGLDNDMLKQLDTYLFPQVKPVIKMLKQTLVGTGAILVTAVLLFTFATPIEEFFQNTFSMKGKITEPVSDISTKYNIRREELLRLPMEVKTDDDLAVSAAQAADGRPV